MYRDAPPTNQLKYAKCVLSPTSQVDEGRQIAHFLV